MPQHEEKEQSRTQCQHCIHFIRSRRFGGVCSIDGVSISNPGYTTCALHQQQPETSNNNNNQ